MKTKPIRRWTLRELLDGSDHVCRDISEHFTKDYIPTLREVARLLRIHKDQIPEVADKTVVNSIQRIERAEAYATELINQLDEILDAIQAQADKEIAESP